MMDEPEKKPKKTPKKRLRKATKKPVNGTSEFNELDGMIIPSLSGLAVIMSACENPAYKRRKSSVDAINTHLQEHLSSFILIGYTIDGEPVNMTYAPTPKDYDSLSTGLQRFIMSSGGF